MKKKRQTILTRKKTAAKSKAAKRIVKSQNKISAKKSVSKRILVKKAFNPKVQLIRRRQTSASAYSIFTDLPFSYNQTRLALLVRDTHWAYCYWDFSAETWGWMQSVFHRDRSARSVLRIHNLDAKSHFDINVSLEAKNWYVDIGQPDAVFEAELGILDKSGKFHRIAKSNRIRTPRNGPSSRIDPLWNADDFDELYKLSGGGKTGRGSEIFSRAPVR